MLATFASAQQADSTDILIYIGKKDTTQSGRWRPGMGVIIREATDIWGRKEMSLEDSLFVRIRVGVAKSRIDSFLVAHNDSTSGLRRKYQLSKAAIRFALENRDSSNVVRVTLAQLRNGFKRTRLRRFGEPQRMGILTPGLFVRWRNMLVAPTLTSVTVNTDGGGDYTALVSAEAGENDDLVTANEQITFNCSGTTADVAAAVFAGWTVDATRLPILQGDNLTGIWDNNKYRQSLNLSSDGFVIGIDYIFIKNMQFEYGMLSGSSRDGLLINIGSNCTVIGSIFRGKNGNGGNGSGGMSLIRNKGILTVSNTIIYDNDHNNQRRGLRSETGTAYTYNLTINNCYSGILRSSGTVTAKNIITQKCTDGFDGTLAAGSDYNISDSLSDAPGANSLNETTVNFADAGAGDFRLLPESPGIDQGADLSAEGVTDDIGGVSRPQGGAFDIGAFEFPVTNDTNTDTKKHKWLEWIKRKKN